MDETSYKLGPFILVSGAKVGDALVKGLDGYSQSISHARDIVQLIAERSLEGREMAARRMQAAMGAHACHHEDYGPIFDQLIGLAINTGAVLKRLGIIIREAEDNAEGL